jgi:hypothetical protein
LSGFGQTDWAHNFAIPFAQLLSAAGALVQLFTKGIFFLANGLYFLGHGIAIIPEI